MSLRVEALTVQTPGWQQPVQSVLMVTSAGLLQSDAAVYLHIAV